MPEKENNGKGAVMRFLYNKSTGEVLGRTFSSWVKVLTFYIFFYAFLIGFFILMLFFLYRSIDAQKPYYEMGDSLIGTNPGMGFKPAPDSTASNPLLISFKKGNESTYSAWTNQLDNYLKMASNTGIPCGYGTGKANDASGCKVDTSTANLGPCNYNPSVKNDYGFKSGSPCILVKLNKIYGWKPEPYNSKDANGMFNAVIYKKSLVAANLPNVLIDSIFNNVINKLGGNIEAQDEAANNVWIHCDGKMAEDRKNMGTVTYFPIAGLTSYSFPYLKQKNYVAPFLMIQFSDLKPGVEISIECDAYANNILQQPDITTGAVVFVLKIEN